MMRMSVLMVMFGSLRHQSPVLRPRARPQFARYPSGRFDPAPVAGSIGDPDRHAHRSARRSGPGDGAGTGGRRLPDQTVQPARAAGADPRRAAAPPARGPAGPP